jgi:hypothetical protein
MYRRTSNNGLPGAGRRTSAWLPKNPGIIYEYCASVPQMVNLRKINISMPIIGDSKSEWEFSCFRPDRVYRPRRLRAPRQPVAAGEGEAQRLCMRQDGCPPFDQLIWSPGDETRQRALSI